MIKFGVKYVVGYLGMGINEYDRICGFESEEAANAKAAELKADNYYDVSVFRYNG